MKESKKIISNEKGKVIIRKKGEKNWFVGMFYKGDLAATESHYFSTKKECVYQGERFLGNL